MGQNLCQEIWLTSTPTGMGKRQINLYYGKTSMDDGVFYASYIPKMTTKPLPKFSRARWYDVELYNSTTPDWGERFAWCHEQFGPDPKNTDAWSRWYCTWDRIRFRDEKDYIWYVLRWGA